MSTLSLVLEFARSELAGDPYAFRLGAQEYVLRREDGSLATSRLVWDDAPLLPQASLRVLRKQRPGAQQRLLPLHQDESAVENRTKSMPRRAATAGSSSEIMCKRCG